MTLTITEQMEQEIKTLWKVDSIYDVDAKEIVENFVNPAEGVSKADWECDNEIAYELESEDACDMTPDPMDIAKEKNLRMVYGY